MRTTALVVLLVSLMAYAPARAQEEPSLPGKGLPPVSEQQILPLVHVCENCHGPNGAAPAHAGVPVIAGKSAEDILAALEQFYFYERHCPDVEYRNNDGDKVIQNMCEIVNGLNRQEALALGRHFEAQKPASGK